VYTEHSAPSDDSHLMKHTVEIHLFCRADDFPPEFNRYMSLLTLLGPLISLPLIALCSCLIVAFSFCTEKSGIALTSLLPHASRHLPSTLVHRRTMRCPHVLHLLPHLSFHSRGQRLPGGRPAGRGGLRARRPEGEWGSSVPSAGAAGG
jgi:hypothetical protein